MKKRMMGILFGLVLALSAWSAAQDAQTESQWNNPGLTKAPNVTHKTFLSASMNTEVGYNIYLPKDYDATKKYPVIYGLHGAGKKNNENSMQYDAERFDRLLRMNTLPEAIIVMVNGKGGDVGYNDWPERNDMGETSFIKELIPVIDREYSTIASREGRALIGFSMGGYGSIRLLSKYPDMFCAAVSFAGAFQWAIPRNMEDALPVIEKNAEALAKYKPAIVLYQGADDQVGTGSDKVHELLKSKGVPSVHTVLPGVGHNYGTFMEMKSSEAIQFIGLAFQGKEAPASEDVTPAIADAPVVVSQPADWCKVTMPSQVSAGDKITYTIEYANVEPATFLTANLGWVQNDGRRGYMGNGNPAKAKIQGSGKQTFTATVTDKGPGITGIVAYIFLSPDGSLANKTTVVSSDPTPLVKKTASAAQSSPASEGVKPAVADAPDAETVVVSQPADWCKVTMPSQVSVGDKITYTIEYANVEPATFLTANLGWVRNDGRRGYMGNGNPAKAKIQGSGKQTFTATVTDKGPGITGVVAYIFLSPDGSLANKTTVVSSDPTPLVKKTASAAQSSPASEGVKPAIADAPDEETVVVSQPADWCKVTMPSRVSVGDKITYTIEYANVEPATFLTANLGWVRNDGRRGYMGNGNPAKVKIQGSGKQTFTATVTDKGPGITGIVAYIFLSPDGSLANKTTVVSSDPTPLGNGIGK